MQNYTNFNVLKISSGRILLIILNLDPDRRPEPEGPDPVQKHDTDSDPGPQHWYSLFRIVSEFKEHILAVPLAPEHRQKILSYHSFMEA